MRSTRRSKPSTKTSRKVKKKNKPEKVIQKEILLWLDNQKLLHWRQNSGYAFVAKRMIKLGQAGLPDIIVVLPPNGHVIGLEVKAKYGKMRPAQEEFEQKMKAAGGIYRVVRSLEDAKAVINEAKRPEGPTGPTGVSGR